MKSTLLEILHGFGEIGLATDGNRKQCTCRGLHCIGIDRNAAFGRDDDSVGSGTFAGPGDSTEIADIGNSIKHYDEWCLTVFVEGRNNRAEPLIGHSRDEGNYALMILTGDAIDSFYRYTLNYYETPFQRLEQLFGKVALQVAFHQYLIYFFAC